MFTVVAVNWTGSPEESRFHPSSDRPLQMDGFILWTHSRVHDPTRELDILVALLNMAAELVRRGTVHRLSVLIGLTELIWIYSTRKVQHVGVREVPVFIF